MSQTQERRSPRGTPRWVKIFAIIAIVLLLIFVGLHLTGHSGTGMHMLPTEQGMQ